MKNYLCSALLAILPIFLIAQGIVTVEPPGGGASLIFTDLQKAIDEAPSGSRVVVSGGVWMVNRSPLNINKKIYLIGAGFDVDSTKSTNRTRILSAMQLEDDADGTTLEGLEIVGKIENRNRSGSISSISNITLRNIKASIIGFNPISDTTPVSNFIIQRSVLQDINFSFSKRVKVSNSIIGFLSFINGEAFLDNNIIMYIRFCVANTIFKNNIILDFSYYNFCGFGCTCPFAYGNFFSNNIFLTVDQSEPFRFDSWSGNKFNVDPISIFVKHDPIWTKFFESDLNATKFDFHLKPNSPAKNAGTDGTDIGIYGGARPWKEGAIPSNPHIQSKTIAPETDAQGRLNVNIRVKAQGN